MKKNLNDKQKEVIKLLEKQKIRDVRDLESYKLSACHPYSAGIDLGSAELYVALSPETAAELDISIVHKFSTFTSDLLRCRDLLKFCGVNTVSMESTSVYWTTIFSILREADIEVCLVNPKKFRMVPGRKTDILDCQWLQILHCYGLLSGSYHPDSEVEVLRSYMRQRDTIIKERTTYVQRMQKALTRMNLLLFNVLDDITGKTGKNIITAILAGERDPYKLAAFRDPRVKKSEAEIAEALTGYYKEDQLYLLKINWQSYCFFDQQLTDIDQQIEMALKRFPLKKTTQEKREDNGKGVSKGKNDIRTKDNLEDQLYHILGVDLSRLPGIRSLAILQIVSEVGQDMSKFPTANHFASYLGFTPNNKITGGRIISSRTDRIKNSAAQTFRKLIPSISQTETALGAFYRRLVPRIGKPQAITASCRKLAILVYNTLVYGQSYIELGQAHYLKKQEDWERKKMSKLASKYNCQIIYNDSISPYYEK